MLFFGKVLNDAKVKGMVIFSFSLWISRSERMCCKAASMVGEFDASVIEFSLGFILAQFLLQSAVSSGNYDWCKARCICLISIDP